MKVNRVDGIRQRISMTSGKVIPKPQESMQRAHPATAAIGPKDTLPSDVDSRYVHFMARSSK